MINKRVSRFHNKYIVEAHVVHIVFKTGITLCCVRQEVVLSLRSKPCLRVIWIITFIWNFSVIQNEKSSWPGVYGCICQIFSHISTYINTKMSVCLFVCLFTFFSAISKPFGIPFGIKLLFNPGKVLIIFKQMLFF